MAERTILELQKETGRLSALLGEYDVKSADVRAQLAQTRAELARRLQPAAEPRFSDHALLRYAERVLGLDLEEVRTRVFTPEIKAAIKAGARQITIDGWRFRIAGNAVVTIIDKADRARLRRVGPRPVDGANPLEDSDARQSERELADAAG